MTPRAGDSLQGATSARAQARRHARRVARLRLATMVLAVLAVVTAPGLYFGLREATRDPVFAELDRWDLPDRAAGDPVDEAYGSRWCIAECRFRERTWESALGPEETERAYRVAIREHGWVPWQVAGCPTAGADGLQTCWQRDELVLTLWVRPPACQLKPARPQVSDGPDAPPGSAPASVPASAPASTTAGQGASGCAAAVSTVKIFNRIAYQATMP